MQTENRCSSCGAELAAGAPTCAVCGHVADHSREMDSVPSPSHGLLNATPASGMRKPWLFSTEVLTGYLVEKGLVAPEILHALESDAGARRRSLVDHLVERKQMSATSLRSAMS